MQPLDRLAEIQRVASSPDRFEFVEKLVAVRDRVFRLRGEPPTVEDTLDTFFLYLGQNCLPGGEVMEMLSLPDSGGGPQRVVAHPTVQQDAHSVLHGNEPYLLPGLVRERIRLFFRDLEGVE